MSGNSSGVFHIRSLRLVVQDTALSRQRSLVRIQQGAPVPAQYLYLWQNLLLSFQRGRSNMEEKKRYGQIVTENFANNTLDDDVIEYRRTMEQDIIRQLYSRANDVKDKPQYANKNFYVVLVNNKERLMQGIRSLVFTRISCPTPVYSQSVWKYHRVSGQLEYLWTIPGEDLYRFVLQNAVKFLQDKETRQLAQFVTLMESGELLAWVKKENGDKKDAVIRINK